MNIKIPTRTVSGTASGSRYINLSGTWQAHTSTSSGTTTVTASATYSSPAVQTYQDSQMNVGAGRWNTYIRAVEIKYITYGGFTVSSYGISGGYIYLNVADGCSDEEGELYIEYYTSYPTATASGTRTGLTSATYSSGTRPDSVSVSGNTWTATWSTTSFSNAGKSVSCRLSLKYSTTTTDYWYANDSYYLGSSSYDYSSFSLSSGTRPTLSGSNGYVYANWTTYSQPSGTTVTCAGYANYTYPTTYTYANVYFNGTRVNYVYFNGTRYP